MDPIIVVFFPKVCQMSLYSNIKEEVHCRRKSYSTKKKKTFKVQECQKSEGAESNELTGCCSKYDLL